MFFYYKILIIMRSLVKYLFLFIFCLVNVNFAFAGSAPVSQKDINNFLNIQMNDKKSSSNVNVEENVKVARGNKKSKEYFVEENTEKEYYQPKSEDKKFTTNIDINNDNDRVLSESTRKINAVYPYDEAILNNNYPGYRGTNQLVIYLRGFGATTGTNEFGKEAVVVDDTVVALTGANSNIPRDGYVISGHGSAKKWITDNLKIGTKIEITDRTIKAYTTIDSYRYQAKAKIDAVSDILVSTKSDYPSRDDKYIYYYLKKAKQQYKKSKKNSSDVCLNCAKEAIKNASIAFRYTLPYMKNEFKGVWIRPTDKSLAGIQQTLNKIKETGIENVFLETYFHGRTIYPSSVMEKYGFEVQNPEFSNIDPLKIWVKEAHKRGIKVHCWFESFYTGNRMPEYNPSTILAVKPDWQNRTKQKADFIGFVHHPQEHNGYFLDPANPEVVDFLVELIDEITTKYKVDGINIDYIRYPNISKENYGNQWGYTPYARNEFMQMYEVDPIDIQPKSDMWDNWSEYRRNKITNYVKRVKDVTSAKNILLSAVIFPDYKLSLQTKYQDWALWADEKYVDAFTPLILTSDDELAKSMLEEIKKRADDNVKIYPGLFAGFIESDPEDLLRQIHITRRLKMNGVIMFDWAHLNDEYRDVLKTSVFKVQTY